MFKESTQDGVISTAGKRSRRQLLTGAVGAIGVIAAGAAVNPTTARAGTDGDVILGVDNQVAGNTTGLITGSDADAFTAASTGNGRGVVGSSGAALVGESQSGEGLFASSGGVLKPWRVAGRRARRHQQFR